MLKLQPNNISILKNKALILLEKNKIEEGIEILIGLFSEKQNDTIINLYTGIYKSLNADYEAAIKIFYPIFSKVDISISKTHKNRGILFLTYCLCQTKAEIVEIKKWFSLIDFEILSANYPNIDEFTLANTLSYIFDNELKSINLLSNSYLTFDNLKKNYLDSTKFFFSIETNSIIADLWFKTLIIQEKAGLISEALISSKKTIELMPEENKYKVKYEEIKKQYNIKILKKKRIKTIKILIIIILSAVLCAIYLKYSAYIYIP